VSVLDADDRLTALAEALADGATPDWASASAAAGDEEERAAIAHLQVIAEASRHNAELAVHASMSVRSLLARGRPSDGSGAGDGPVTWGPLLVHEKIGRGRFGDVYRAWDPSLDRDVALKLLRHDDGGEDRLVVDEGRLMARVRHPNVATIHGALRIDGLTGLWMELIEGQTLEAELAGKGPFPTGEIVRIGVELCRALDAVHRAGLVHRDVKAQNVLQESTGRIVLGDFGTGRELDESDVEAVPAGTPVYLAPEIFSGAPATPASDLYSLGILLYHLATGAYPVEGRSLRDIRAAHVRGTRTTLRSRRPELPATLVTAIDTALEPDPIRRFASARAMEAALLRALPAPASRIRGRRALIGAAALMVALTAGAAATWGWGAWPGSKLAIPFAAREWVLVAGFENRSSNPAFDDVLEPALVRELAASGFVNVVPRARVEDTLSLMRQPVDLKLDARTAREVSVRDGGIRALLTGRIDKIGQAFVLTTDIVRPVDGVVMASISLDVPGAEMLLARIQQQALRVREALGETLPALTHNAAGLQRVTTPSLPALRLYSEAAALMDGEAWLLSLDLKSRYASAEALLRRATEADPTFASAWLLLAQTVRGQSRPAAEALSFAERALTEATRATPVERCFIEAIVHRFRADAGSGRNSDLEASARAFEALLRLSPDHYWGLLELGQVYQRLQRFDDAGRIALHAATIRPHSIKFSVDALKVLMANRDTSALARRAPELLARIHGDPAAMAQVGRQCSSPGCVGVDVAWLQLWEMTNAWLDGDAVAALEALRAADAKYARKDTPGWPYWQNQLLHAYIGLGRFDEARKVAARAPPVGRRWQTALVEARLEDREAFDRVAGPLNSHEARSELRYMLLWVGRLDEAALVDDERRRRPRPNATQTQWIEWEGHLREAQGRHAEAIALLEPLARDAIGPRPRMQEVLASARRGMGDVRGAIATLAFSDRRAVAVMPTMAMYDWLRCRVLLAELQRQLGWIDEAEQVEAEVRRLMQVAEPNHPLFRRLGP
jgi:tetratricopeptide (TPR) repeat protein